MPDPRNAFEQDVRDELASFEARRAGQRASRRAPVTRPVVHVDVQPTHDEPHCSDGWIVTVNGATRTPVYPVQSWAVTEHHRIIDGYRAAGYDVR